MVMLIQSGQKISIGEPLLRLMKCLFHVEKLSVSHSHMIITHSVLDDNKLLTLPSGERLSIPDNVRILLEVDSLEQATPASVSCCGMIWFSADTISSEMCLEHLMGELRTENIVGDSNLSADAIPSTQLSFLDAIQGLVISQDAWSTSLVADALEFALSNKEHIMKNIKRGVTQEFEVSSRERHWTSH